MHIFFTLHGPVYILISNFKGLYMTPVKLCSSLLGAQLVYTEFDVRLLN